MVDGRYLGEPGNVVLEADSDLAPFRRWADSARRDGSVLWMQLPVSANFDDTGAWVISQHGLRSGWAKNIAADPRVRIHRSGRWVSATAALVPDDDVAERARSFAPTPALRSAFGAAFRAMESDPVSVRITFTDAEPDPAPEPSATTAGV